MRRVAGAGRGSEVQKRPDKPTTIEIVASIVSVSLRLDGFLTILFFLPVCGALHLGIADYKSSAVNSENCIFCFQQLSFSGLVLPTVMASMKFAAVVLAVVVLALAADVAQANFYYTNSEWRKSIRARTHPAVTTASRLLRSDFTCCARDAHSQHGSA